MVKSCKRNPETVFPTKANNALAGGPAGFVASRKIIEGVPLLFTHVGGVNPPSMVTFEGMNSAVEMV
jgi:hypothetical protein